MRTLLENWDLCLIVGSWITYCVLFGRLMTAPGPKTESANDSSWMGLTLQMVAVAVLLFGLRDPYADPLEIVLRVSGVLLSWCSVWLSWSSLRYLGSQWSFRARLHEDHQLITSGPFSKVRHPLFLAFFLLTVGTGLPFSTWPALLVATVLSLAGVAVRVRAEETLLRGRFGEQYERYADRVPAFIPSLRGR